MDQKQMCYRFSNSKSLARVPRQPIRGSLPAVPNQLKRRYPLHCQRLSGALIVARPDLRLLAYIIVKSGTHRL